MEKENVIIVTDQKTIELVVENAVKRANQEKETNLTDFEKDRCSKPEGAKLAGLSIPSFDKQIKLGKFKQYNLGARVYFLRSEIIESLRNNG